MRLFISYARVDKPYCIQIVEILDVHEIWYDQRIYAGQNWWKEILRRLEWCEGFVYLMSPESIASEYCRREFELAQKMGKHIFPVLIHEKAVVPESIKDVQHADLSKGLTPEAVRILLNSIYMAERQKPAEQKTKQPSVNAETIKPPSINPATVISAAAAAMEKGQYDQAVYLLKQAKAQGFTSRFINIDKVLEEAENALDRQSYLREAEREYKQIAELVRYQRTRQLGCEAFSRFRGTFPDYDPDNLAPFCGGGGNGSSPASRPLAAPGSGTTPPALALPQRSAAAPAQQQTLPATVQSAVLPLLEWCDIPAGMVTLTMTGKNGHPQGVPYYLDAFRVTKYPITNAQYQVFLDDPSGYANLSWWQFSSHAHQWRINNPEPKPSRFQGEERPREMVNWFDAMAFTYWLSARMGIRVTLPTEAQWQRAAQGDDGRLYCWGNAFDKNRCNTRESDLKMTTLVMRFPEGVSPFGVFDMCGNVWEWCLNTRAHNGPGVDITTDEERAIRGGAYIGPQERAQIPFRYYLQPKTYYASIGFRVVQPGVE